MKYPVAIREYLESEYTRQRRPFCFRIDAKFRLIDWWGDASEHHFDDLREGEDMTARAPYLVGHLGGATERLPFVTANGRTAEVHILPDKDLHFVIVMDASAEHDFRQKRQQVANELRLMHAAREKLIEQQRALIGDLVEARTELDHRRSEAERANERRSEFFAMMSHEFRTPLSSIINYAGLALEEDTSIDNVRKSAEAISRAARHMNRLVDTVLDEARLEAGQMVLTEAPFNVHALLDDIATIMAPLAAEKQLSFGAFVDNDVPEMLDADDACLRQILINLLGNAVKFTEAGGVRLDVAWSDGNLHATVTDTGPGIAAADQERVFEAFERATTVRNDNSQGTGLGLAITLGLARLMRGSIDLDSEPGAGCKISVVVPAPVAAESRDEKTALPVPDNEYQTSRPATILVCDDDEDLLALAEYYLLRAGYGLLLARDGKEAVEKALAYAPDLVLMDINTPRLPGSVAAAELRSRGFSAPIIALTASDVRKLDTDTFAACLRKPIQMPRLLAAIQSHIEDC